MASTVPLFPIFSFLGFALQLVPLYWQIERWNVGTLWYIFWISLSCITQYFNSVVWAGNTNNPAPGWCEIAIRVSMGASVGIPAASMCINRRLYEIARLPPTDEVSKAQHRRLIIVDSIVCGLLPAVYILLQLAVQRHRFNILEDVGCVPDFYDALSTYFIAYAPPALLNLGSLVFGALALRALAAARANITEVLAPYNSLTLSRFLRLAGIALATSIFLSAPSALLNIAANVTAAALATKVVSGAASPFSFSTIVRIPRSVWASDETNLVAVELGQWLAPACAFLFFAFHGFTADAREYYMRAFVVTWNAFWNTLASMGYFRAPPASTVPRDTPAIRLPVISRPVRGVSGTGSLVDPASPQSHRSSDWHVIAKSALSDTDVARPAYVYDPFNQPVAYPTTTRGGLSFVPVVASLKEPGKYIIPPYQGWHTFSNAQLGMEDRPVVRPVRRGVVEAARKVEALPESPPLRRIL
ncbi:pheromone A receptor-domain-containing protein [Mycena sanguinolenta]|nr:pheromone A receptor-domain-containing protein [Mycena sanguinolenta]